MRGVILSFHRVATAEFDPWGLRVTPDKFAAQMAVLSSFGEPMSLPHFVESRRRGRSSDRAIVVTFDDGYIDNYTAGLEILRRFRIPATVFVSTGYTGRPYFWWEVLEQVFLRPGRLPEHLSLEHAEMQHSWILGNAADYSLEEYAADCVSCKWRGLPGTRVRLYFEVYDALWLVPHIPRLELTARLVAWAGLDDASFADSRPMRADEVVALSADELITIGGHSVDHLPLDEATRDTQVAEIGGGQAYLERIVNRRVTSFAYPHGKYGDETVSILRELGFACACTTEEAIVGPSADDMLLPRLQVRNWSGDEFSARLGRWLAG